MYYKGKRGNHKPCTRLRWDRGCGIDGAAAKSHCAATPFLFLQGEKVHANLKFDIAIASSAQEIAPPAVCTVKCTQECVQCSNRCSLHSLITATIVFFISFYFIFLFQASKSYRQAQAQLLAISLNYGLLYTLQIAAPLIDPFAIWHTCFPSLITKLLLG